MRNAAWASRTSRSRAGPVWRAQRRRSAASIANCGWPSGPSREQRAEIRRARAASMSASRSAVAPAGDLRRQVARSEIEKPPQDIGRHETAAEKRRQALRAASARAAARTPWRHRRRSARGDGRSRSARSSASADEPRNLGLVGQIEARVDVGFERELADERQAERVDRRDRDLAETLAQRLPASPPDNWDVRLASFSRSTIRCRISAAAFRVNVMARMCSGSTPASSRLT